EGCPPAAPARGAEPAADRLQPRHGRPRAAGAAGKGRQACRPVGRPFALSAGGAYAGRCERDWPRGRSAHRWPWPFQPVRNTRQPPPKNRLLFPERALCLSYHPFGHVPPPVHLQFDDNRLLPLLFGEHDQHLARIERELGVSMVSRGNQLVISGAGPAVATARQVMTSLYQRLKRGLEVDKHEVDAALRIARSESRAEGRSDGRGDGRGGEDGEPNLFGNDMKDGTAIRTQRRHITPRSAAQATYIRQLHDRELVFGIGPAGTGKTYLAVAVAVAMLT